MVQVKPNTETGALVTAYENNAEFGYVILESIETVFENGWMQEKKRSTIMKGKVETLTRFFANQGTLQGRISVTECLEDAIPPHLVSQLNKNLAFEEQIEPFIKKAGQDGINLTQNGSRILRFTAYDASGTSQDTRVQHDNIAEVKAQNAMQSDASNADLPS